MDARRVPRAAAATGLASIACAGTAEAFERGAVRATATPAQIAAYYSHNASALRWQGLFFLLSSGFALWFLPSLTHYLGRAEGARSRVAGIALAAAVTSIGVTFVAVAAQLGLATAPGLTTPAATAGLPALVAFVNALFAAACLPNAVMLAAVATLTWRTRALPEWMAWLSTAAAATQLLPVLGVVTTSGPLASGAWASAFVPYPLYAVWVVCAAILLLRRSAALGTPGA